MWDYTSGTRRSKHVHQLGGEVLGMSLHPTDPSRVFALIAKGSANQNPALVALKGGKEEKGGEEKEAEDEEEGKKKQQGKKGKKNKRRKSDASAQQGEETADGAEDEEEEAEEGGAAPAAQPQQQAPPARRKGGPGKPPRWLLIEYSVVKKQRVGKLGSFKEAPFFVHACQQESGPFVVAASGKKLLVVNLTDRKMQSRVGG